MKPKQNAQTLRTISDTHPDLATPLSESAAQLELLSELLALVVNMPPVDHMMAMLEWKDERNKLLLKVLQPGASSFHCHYCGQEKLIKAQSQEDEGMCKTCAKTINPVRLEA